ncbi:hypothetical protein A3D60_04390 [Candidatus Uhrbacteria bacterium RIFCSPHIGHO2_02_FULL_47_29]|nr:MAG: hypothetical protein A3D60_04390 [Candidatus Uhrbacteria bacterium RIFCSPHIGHO2_02_FULL_47_29]OGL84554.1 MAG: hypothetical protein A3I37_02330 [Candidatus Uhrbacteria bacterium RIFCSPLOWO2_02_FULL_46_19]
MGRLLTTDIWRQHQQLRRDEVLLPFNGGALCGVDDEIMNLVLVHCGDGHRAPHFIGDLERVTQCRHAIAINGGALWLDPRFRDPFFNSRQHDTIRTFLVYQFIESMILKSTNRGGVVIHLDPCGKARRHEIQLLPLLGVAVAGKQLAKQQTPKIVQRLHRLDTFSKEELDIVSKVEVAPMSHVHNGSELLIDYINEDHPRFRHLRDLA